jgi:hypothetical protein
VSELVRRLREYYERAEEGSGTPPEGPLAIGVDDPLPLDDFMEVGWVVTNHVGYVNKAGMLQGAVDN